MDLALITHKSLDVIKKNNQPSIEHPKIHDTRVFDSSEAL